VLAYNAPSGMAKDVTHKENSQKSSFG